MYYVPRTYVPMYSYEVLCTCVHVCVHVCGGLVQVHTYIVLCTGISYAEEPRACVCACARVSVSVSVSVVRSGCHFARPDLGWARPRLIVRGR